MSPEPPPTPDSTLQGWFTDQLLCFHCGVNKPNYNVPIAPYYALTNFFANKFELSELTLNL